MSYRIGLLALSLVACAKMAPPPPVAQKGHTLAKAQVREPPPPVESRATQIEVERTHRVAPGETAYRIAKTYGITVDALVAANRLASATRIYVGQSLKIPSADPLALPTPLLAAPEKEPDDSKKEPVKDPPVATEIKSDEPEPIDLTPPPVVIEGCPKGQQTPGEGFLWPVEGVIIARFGRLDGEPHDGIDIAAPVGEPVRVVADGEVVFAGERTGYGHMVIVRHTETLATVYARHERNCVTVGDRLLRGQVLGLVGASGTGASPHLHFEIREDDRPINPKLKLR